MCFVSMRLGFKGDMGVSTAFSVGFSMVISTAFSTMGVVLSLEISGGVLDLSLPPSNFAASDAVLSGRGLAFVELDVLRVYSGRSGRSRAGDSSCGPGESGRSSREGERKCDGELGRSPALAVPAVFNHDGACCEALLVVAWRRGAGDKAPGVSFGFSGEPVSGEPVGVEGRAVDGEACLMEPGRPKGDWREPRALLKKRGDGFESVGADCGMLVYRRRSKTPAGCIP